LVHGIIRFVPKERYPQRLVGGSLQHNGRDGQRSKQARNNCQSLKMGRHFDDPKHLRIKERWLYIRVATDAAGADTITAFGNSEDRANDVNRLQERTALSALIPKQEIFDSGCSG
jgi:hypothetical protein